MILKKPKISYKILFLLTALLLIPVFTQVSGQDFKKTATSGFVFLELPATARTAALGEASLSLADLNSDAVFNNPGALGFTNRTHSFAASYSPWFADIKNYTASYSFKSNFGVFGVGAIMMDYGSMPRTEIASGQKVYQVLGTFEASSTALGLSYSKMLTDRFSFGVSIKYVNEKIDIYSADNVLFDGGALYYTGLGSMRIAASIQNFGVDAKFLNDKFKMPAILRLGISGEVVGDKDSDYRVTLLAEATHPNDADERVNTGVEISWKNIITLRGGYKFFYDEETFSIGAGISAPVKLPVILDFAFSDYGRLGNITRITVQLGIL